MIIGPKYKICRRLGSGVFDKCQSQKFMLSEGRHAKNKKRGRRKQVSEYGIQLIEKQKIRFSYGLSERQLANYVKEAVAVKGMPATDKLYELLESRLDNIIYRSGIAHTRPLARQIATHGHFIVGEHRTDVPSYRLKIGDKFSVREGSRGSVLFQDLGKKLEKYNFPMWIKFDGGKMEGEVVGKPKKDDMFLNLEKVLEYYSR